MPNRSSTAPSPAVSLTTSVWLWAKLRAGISSRIIAPPIAPHLPRNRLPPEPKTLIPLVAFVTIRSLYRCPLDLTA